MPIGSSPPVTAIVPVLHDDDALRGLLEVLRDWPGSVIVVDGADAPATAALVERFGARYLASEASRGGQIAAGIAAASSAWLWVLHADTRPSAEALADLADIVAAGQPAWGRFDVVLPRLALVAGMMNWRSRLTRICTGDQAMFFHAGQLEHIGGFPQQPLMEDIEVSKRLKRAAGAQFSARRARVESSSRRWFERGVLRTILSMWRFRLRYFFGAPARRLATEYYGPD